MMNIYARKERAKLSYRILSAFIAFTVSFTSVLPPGYAQVLPQTFLNLPAPGTMVVPTTAFTPALINGITIHPENPLEFDFIVGTGDDKLQGKAFEDESTKLIKYFLASLTVPEDEMWVNLSPYEKDRIIPTGFGTTEMGRDLLAQDYILKQLTASLMYPEKELGSEFWKKIYQKAREQYGTTEIPVNTFNKVWIVPEKAIVYEHGNSAFVVKSRLKVMLEEDYMAVSHQSSVISHQKNDSLTTDDRRLTTQIIREVILPAIEKEVNEGKGFANLRQIYNSAILAAWFKQKLKVGTGRDQSLLGQVYVDKTKTKGVDVDDKTVNEKIYAQYLEAFQKGVYNYIKEDVDPATQEMIPRKYFSGGIALLEGTNLQVDIETLKDRSASPLQKQIIQSFLAGKSAEQQIIVDTHFLELSAKTPIKDVQKAVDSSRRAREAAVEEAYSAEEYLDSGEEAGSTIAAGPEAGEKKVSSPMDAESPQLGISKQKDKLEKALRDNLSEDYYDVVYLVVDDASYAETKELVKTLRGVVIPENAQVDIIRQPEGRIKGNWSAVINILMDKKRWETINNDPHQNIAVILSGGTGSRNYPLTATGYGDKGKQAAPNGHTYIEQQFKQIMQYFQTGHKGMLVVPNDGIKALSREVVSLGVDQGIQFLGSTLPILSKELDDLGGAIVQQGATTEGKPVVKFVEKGPVLKRIMTFYGAKTEGEAQKILEQIERGEIKELSVPANWADYHLTIEALRRIYEFYQGLLGVEGRPLYLEYGLDTAKDLFEAASLDRETYVKEKEAKKWRREDAIRVRDVSLQLQQEFGLGFISTGSNAIFIDTGTNVSYSKAAQRLLTDKNMRDLLDVDGPVDGNIIGKNVALGKDVILGEGVVLLGHVYIKQGRIGKGTVVINTAVNELYAGENSLIYSVEELDKTVYVRTRNLATDIFFKRKVYLSPTDIAQNGERLFHVTSQKSHDPGKPPHLMGSILISPDNKVVDQPWSSDLAITDINGQEAVLSGKIHINMPLRLTAKDIVREYNLEHPALGVIGHVVTIAQEGDQTLGEIREFYPLGEGVRNRDLLLNVLAENVQNNLTVKSKDDVLYTVEGSLADKKSLWEANIWPRNPRSYNQYPSISQETRPYKFSFAAIAAFFDKEATGKFLMDRLPRYVEEARKSAASPVGTEIRPLEQSRPSKFGTSGDRGLIGKDFNFPLIRKLAQGTALYARESYLGQRTLIGRDTRKMNAEFQRETAMIHAGNGMPVIVVEDEPIPTPVLAFYASTHDEIGGVINLTASHSPYTDGGFKFSPSHGGAADQQVTDRIQDLSNSATDYKSLDYEEAKRSGLIGVITAQDAVDQYVNGYLLPVLKETGALNDIVSYIKSHPDFELVLDPMQGTGVRVMQTLYAAIAEEAGRNFFVIINEKNKDPEFKDVNGAPQPDKSTSNGKLVQKVREKKGRLGLSVDGDVDRFGTVDFGGEFFGANDLIALLSFFFKKDIGLDGAIGKTVATSDFVNAVAEYLGSELDEEKVGFKWFVRNIINGRKYLVAGEESAHVAVGPFMKTFDDGFAVGLTALWLVARSNMSLAEYKNKVESIIGKKFLAKPGTIRRADIDAKQGTINIVREVNDELSQGKQANELTFAKKIEVRTGLRTVGALTKDGVKLFLEGGASVLLRPSGTEPAGKLYTFMAFPYEETSDVEKLNRLYMAVEEILFEASPASSSIDGKEEDQEVQLSLDDEDIVPVIGITDFLKPGVGVADALVRYWQAGGRGPVSLLEIVLTTRLEKEFVLAALNGINGNFNSSFSVKPVGEPGQLHDRLTPETRFVQLVARRSMGESRPLSQGIQPHASSPIEGLEVALVGGRDSDVVRNMQLIGQLLAANESSKILVGGVTALVLMEAKNWIDRDDYNYKPEPVEKEINGKKKMVDVRPGILDDARSYMNHSRVILPSQVEVMDPDNPASREVIRVGIGKKVPAGKEVVGFGKETINTYADMISGSRSTFWSGPMDVDGTPQKIIESLAQAQRHGPLFVGEASADAAKAAADLTGFVPFSRDDLSKFLDDKAMNGRRGITIPQDKDLGNGSRARGEENLGGINLDPGLFDLQIKRDGNGVPLPLPQQPIQNMNIEGFIPVIIHITPVTDLPMLLGIAEDELPDDSADAGSPTTPMILGLARED